MTRLPKNRSVSKAKKRRSLNMVKDQKTDLVDDIDILGRLTTAGYKVQWGKETS